MNRCKHVQAGPFLTGWPCTLERDHSGGCVFQPDAVKLCTRCGVDKPLDGFAKRARSKDGLQPWCRDCSNAARSPHAKALAAAYDRAQRRLRLAHLDEFQRYYTEEKQR